MANSPYLLFPDGASTRSLAWTTDPNIVGQKGIGLAKLPQKWRPPYAIVSAAACRDWLVAEPAERGVLLSELAKSVEKFLPIWDQEYGRGVIIRSSATHETLQDRGRHESRPLTADYNSEYIERAIATIFDDFSHERSVAQDDHLALIIQPLLGGVLGHLSNERRVSKTQNQWMYEIQSAKMPPGRFNSQRAHPPHEKTILSARNQQELIAQFRSVGRWCTKLGKGPAHLEWVWDRPRLCLLQLDFEDDAPDDGVDPSKLLREVDVRRGKLPRSSSWLKPVPLRGALTGWSKVDKVRELASGVQGYPKLAYLEASAFPRRAADRTALVGELQEFTSGRAICRTECRTPSIESVNLPRTHTVGPEQAVAFMEGTIKQLVGKGAKRSDICFVLHQFVPAHASAWVMADPSAHNVRVDGLWGVPDGLQYLEHDTFEYDCRRKTVAAERPRYKQAFIQEANNGEWKEVRVARKLARRRSLSWADVSSIAEATARFARSKKLPVQVMWFCETPKELGLARNVPWIFMPYKPTALARSIMEWRGRRRIPIRTENDIEMLLSANLDKSIVSLQPDVSLIREDDKFLKRVGEVCKVKGIPVELRGSILGHAYYVLDKLGVTVIASDESGRRRIRGLQKFEKIVRDEVPAVIEHGGESVSIARIAKRDARNALLVKLLEELQEVRAAEGPTEMTAELADMLEVIVALANAAGVEWKDVMTAAEEKRRSRGSFQKGVVLLESYWEGPKVPRKQGNFEIPLSSLARERRRGDQVEIAYPALLATRDHVRVELPSGGEILISMSGRGIVVREAGSGASEPPNQLSLPLFEKAKAK